MRKLRVKIERLKRKILGIKCGSDYRKELRDRYRANPKLWFTDNYD